MLGIFVWAVGYVLTFLVAIPLNGLLISLAWGWFVAPILGSRGISIAEGIGLSFFLSIAGAVATSHLNKPAADGETDPRKIAANTLGQMLGVGVAGPALAIAMGWAWHTFAISN